MKFFPQSQITLENLLQNIPPHIAATFDNAQLDALEQALRSRPGSRHRVNLCFPLLPFGPKFCEVVVLVPEPRLAGQRSGRRRGGQRSPSHKIMVMAGCTILSALVLLGVMGISQIRWPQQQKAIAPATVPFKGDKTTCERSDRVWRNGECIDFEHDPIF
jgi:hypothetical protein